MAENFLERVEKKIEIIDSITVPKKTFFKNYLLPPSSGYLGDGAMLPNGADADEVDYVFTNEGEITQTVGATRFIGCLPPDGKPYVSPTAAGNPPAHPRR